MLNTQILWIIIVTHIHFKLGGFLSKWWGYGAKQFNYRLPGTGEVKFIVEIDVVRILNDSSGFSNFPGEEEEEVGYYTVAVE